MADGIPIRLKRAKNYLTATGVEIDYVADRVLEYGEPIFLLDLGFLVIGDGVRPVKELIPSRDYFVTQKNVKLGNITSEGTIEGDPIGVGEGDHLVVCDADGNIIIKSSIAFGSATDKWLCNTGEWTTPTPEQIGASKSDHTHLYAGSTKAGGPAQMVDIVKKESTKLYVTGVTATDSTKDTGLALHTNSNVYIGNNNALYGAAWNDFAEYRKCIGGKPGSVVCEVGDGSLKPSYERLQAGASIISDTFGMVIGDQANDAQPVTVAGRVLAHYIGEASQYKAGDAVCAAQFGRIDKMTREEIREFPDRILGYVSEIPTYLTWHGVDVDGRIWIKIK